MTDIYPHKSRNWFWNVWHKNKILTGSNNLMEHFRDNGYRGVGSGKIMHHERHADWHEFPHAADYGPVVLKEGMRVAHPGVPEPFRSIGPIDVLRNNRKEEHYDHRSDTHEWSNPARSPEHSDILVKMAGRLSAGVLN